MAITSFAVSLLPLPFHVYFLAPLFALHFSFLRHIPTAHTSCAFLVFPSAHNSEFLASTRSLLCVARFQILLSFGLLWTHRLAASDAARHTTFHRYTVGER